MKYFQYPAREIWQEILQRPVMDLTQLQPKVSAVMAAVKEKGDAAIQQYTLDFDGVDLADFTVGATEMAEAAGQLTDALKTAIEQAAANITSFHRPQLQVAEKIETMPGVLCWRKSIGIGKVGLYIPGGTAPLFSTVLMLGIPAVLAGCKEIILCSPPDKKGRLHPAILFAAQTAGITRIYKIGGVQAIAAMAYGTASVPQVYKIFGPGNQYVTLAKQLVQQDGIAIDMPAGPSEVCVLADDTGNPAFIASDLLSQAEHGADSQVLLVTTSEALIEKVTRALDIQLAALPRKEMATRALSHSRMVLVKSMDEAIAMVNDYAAEHLIIACEEADVVAEKVINAGSVFLGNYSPESVGDYASGTNHTLPTNGFARAYSGVSIDSFVKKVTFQKLSREGLTNIGKTVMEMAGAEGLAAHANAVSIRLKAASTP